jgi:hypothetical protein
VLFCPQNNYSTFAQPFQWVCRLLLAKKIGDFMNNHELDSLESSEALGEDDSAVDFAFDLGTSPHGLSADLPETVGKARELGTCAPSAARP